MMKSSRMDLSQQKYSIHNVMKQEKKLKIITMQELESAQFLPFLFFFGELIQVVAH